MSETSILTPKQELEMRIYAFALYCEDRQAFASTVQRASSIAGILAGTALVAVAQSNSPELSVIAVIIGFAAILLPSAIFIFDMPGVEKSHAELRKTLVDLGQRVENGGDLDLAQAEFHKVYANCPFIFHAADAVALNTMQGNKGRPERLVIKRWQRIVRNLWRFNSNTFTTWEDIRTTSD